MYLLYINAAPTDNCYCPDLQLETSTSNFPASLHQNSQAHGCHPHHCAARTLDEERTAYFPEACFASRRHPSCKRSVSTSWAGRWTYLTVEPRMKTFFTDRRCGYRWIVDTNICKFEVQELVRRLQCAGDAKVVLQLNGDLNLSLNQRPEEGEEEHAETKCTMLFV